MNTRAQRLALLLVSIATSPAISAAQSVQDPRRLALRLDGGSLNPDDPFTVTLAYGVQLGWQLTERSALFFGAMRQELSRDIQGFPQDDERTYVIAGFERYLGWEHIRRQRIGVRLAGGFAVRRPLKTAPFIAAGVVIRYPLSPSFAFVARVEDAVAFLPTDSATYCPFGPPCTTYRTGGKAQHNFGLFISAELRR